jgi:hypothetical protein
MLLIPVIWRLRQEDQKFEPSLANLERPCLKIKYKMTGNVTVIEYLLSMHDALGSMPSTKTMQIKTTMRCHFTTTRIAIINKMDQKNVGEDV